MDQMLILNLLFCTVALPHAFENIPFRYMLDKYSVNERENNSLIWEDVFEWILPGRVRSGTSTGAECNVPDQSFTCYRCSYATETEGSRRDCINNPSALGFGSHLECNSTSYCVLQEQYDIHREIVTSYFRSCSGNSWGNECNKDWSHVTCKASCQGNYCNDHDVGKRFAKYLAEHKDTDYFNTGTVLKMNVCIYVSTIVLLTYILRKMYM